MDIKAYYDTEITHCYVFDIRRNKTLLVEILLLFCRDIASPTFVFGHMRQVAMIAENNRLLQSRREDPVSVDV
jgi:hypothetical protein